MSPFDIILAFEISQMVVILVWIALWSRIIIPRRRILGVLNRIENLLDEKDKELREKDAALEHAHRENESILINAIDISKKLRHCYVRNHENENTINDLRDRLGLPRLAFEKQSQQNTRKPAQKNHPEDAQQAAQPKEGA